MLVVVLSACTSPPGTHVREVPEPAQTSADSPQWWQTAVPPRPVVGATPPAPAPQTPSDTGEEAPQPPPPLVAAITADVLEGDFPLTVTFDSLGSELGGGAVEYEWDYGDGATDTAVGGAAHTYIGAGTFVAQLSLVDDATGESSNAQVTIEVNKPECPREDEPVEWGEISDGGLDSVSGIAASRIDDDAYWIHEDRHGHAEVIAVDTAGDTIGEYDLTHHLTDFEDIEATIDPATGVPWLFLGDIGDNNATRSHVSVWMVEEPDPRADGELDPFEVELTYPDGPHDAETLMVDPLTFDIYVVTKVFSGDADVYVKRAPHEPGEFELEHVGNPWTLDLTATSGDVSPDGSRVVVRDYSDTVRMFFRDGYLPFEDAFDDSPCHVSIHDDAQGEAVAFTPDGTGVVTTSEGAAAPLYFVAF